MLIDLGNSYQGRRVLVTGGLGFIGSNLARALVSAGADVVLLDSLEPKFGGNEHNIDDFRERVQVVRGDLRNHELVRESLRDADVVFNLAGQTSHMDSMRWPIEDLEINAHAQLALLEACRTICPKARLVYAGTRQVYGRPDYLPVDELHPVRPVDVNGINKLSAEWFHLLYGRVYGMRTTVLRLTNTYGPGMRVRDARQTFLGIWIRRLIEGAPILVYGDGTQIRDFTYVDDCVSAMLLAGMSDIAVGKTYNLGGVERITLMELAQRLAMLRTDAEVRLVPFPEGQEAIDIGDYYADFRLAADELGWRPTVNLEQGLARTVNYFEWHQSHYWDDCAS